MMKHLILCVLLLVSCFLWGCTQTDRLLTLPPPEQACLDPDAASWRGLIPGVSTREDVLRALGEPAHATTQLITDFWQVHVYAYPIEGGELVGSEFDHYKIYFRQDGVIDWMEIPVADTDGKYYALQDTVDRLGASVDADYLNSIGDIYGPDWVTVWAECGTAVLTLYECQPLSWNPVPCHTPSHWLSPTQPMTQTLTLREQTLDEQRIPAYILRQIAPPPPEAGTVLLHTNVATLLLVLFPPTSYESYLLHFANVLPGAHYYDLGLSTSLFPTATPNSNQESEP